MKKVYLCSFVFLMLFMPSLVKAECTAEEKERFNGLLNKVEIKKQYMEETYYNGVRLYNTFAISISNLTDDMYVFDSDSELYYYGKNRDANGILVFPIYEFGTRNLTIVTGDKVCALQKTIAIVIPKFNNYSLASECEGIDSTKFKYCDPWYQGDIEYADFEKKLSNYKKNFNDDKAIKEDIDENFWVNISNFVNENMIYFIGVGVIALVTLCTSIIIRKRRDKDEFKK